MATTALSAYKAGQRSSRSVRRHRRKQFTIPIAVVGGFAPLALGAFGRVNEGPARVMNYVTQAMTGYDTDTGKFWYPNMWKGMFPILLGLGVHMIASKMGINRALSRSGIPFLRV